jgi:1-acyl-sn-glycerol-3-phosphate acyltransferase
MARKQGPWKHNFWYTVLRYYVDACTRFSYRSLRVEGLENIPSEGAVIISPNHSNTLMDALVVLGSRKGRTVFGARADIFENPTVASILRFLRILPMVRRRDGIRNVLRNYETIDQVVDVLDNGVPFCMFAEGRHRAMHSLLPINKGIFRIAKMAHEALGDKKDVFLVPTGLDYGDYFLYRTWFRLRYGKAINVSEFIRQNEDLSEPELFAGLRERLVGGISSRIVCLPDDENYSADWEAFQQRFAALNGNTYRDAGLPRKRSTRLALAVLTALPFAVSAVLTAPMWGVAEWLCHKKIKDRAFHNTARFAMKLLGNIIIGIPLAVVFFVNLPWCLALAALLYFFASYSIFYDWLNLIRR